MDITFTPYTGSANGGGVGSIQLTYRDTLVYMDPTTNDPTTGLDPTTTRSAGTGPATVGAATSPFYGDLAISTGV